ncbi:hypothetical protein [uncultured Mediterranean phage uvMED]|nr:hypothetical protein [uncultured Mediterranean phage uvMED]BAR16539.1 hypothetical protein [uncultured Mediterranean phage uvMED]
MSQVIAKQCLWVMVILILVYGITDAIGDVTSSGNTTNSQSNNAGSNTAITGGYESSTTYQSGSSSNSTTNNETNNSTNQKTAVNSASAPSMSVYGQDSCVIPLASGVTIIGFSGSFGTYVTDESCERRKSIAVLAKLGMKVAAISLACQDENIWQAMMDAGTPCPIDGLIGEKAKARWMEKRKQELTGATQTKPSMTWND